MLDYHVHLWPHAEVADPLELTIERLAGYCDRAAGAGVSEIALTEHLFRFRSARELIGPFWRDDRDAVLARAMEDYWDHHATADLDRYVEVVLAARTAGLPLLLGLEVDYYPGRMDDVAALLAGYPFDVLLGSVHWLGAFMFDDPGSAATLAEWDRRGEEAVWRAYTDALCELAATRTCDVLAHPDLVKVLGRYPSPGHVEECEDRIAEAAAASGMSAEVSSAGWRKPAGEQYTSQSLLAKLVGRDVPLTTASDTHGVGNVAFRAADLRTLVEGAGCGSLASYRSRVRHEVPLG